MANRWKKVETVTDFSWTSKSLQMVTAATKLRHLPLEASVPCPYDKQRHHFVSKDPYSQSYGFSNSHVWMWELDHKDGWARKNWCSQIVVLEKTLESPMNSKIKPLYPKGNQPLILIGNTDAEAEASILWPPGAKSKFTGEDWGQEEKEMTEMRWLNGITDSVDMSLS